MRYDQEREYVTKLVVHQKCSLEALPTSTQRCRIEKALGRRDFEHDLQKLLRAISRYLENDSVVVSLKRDEFGWPWVRASVSVHLIWSSGK